MKRKIAIIALVLATALPVGGQNQEMHTSHLAQVANGKNLAVLPPARPVARVNGAVLTDRDLLREMYSIFPYAKQHGGGFPKAMEADIRQGALKMIEFEELVYQEAKRRQMKVAPERLAKSEKLFREQFETDGQYQQFLQVEGNGSKQVIREKITRSLLIEDLLKAEVTQKSWVSLAEAKAFYLKYPERFKLPESYALQTITIMPPTLPNPKQTTPQQPTLVQWNQMRARAEDALRQAKATKNYEEFGILAEKISEDDYRVMMGNHKTVKATQLPPAILQAASKLKPGQISDLIQADGAYTIIRINAHSPAQEQKFEDMYNALRAEMRQRKSEQLRRELDVKLRKTAKIEEF